MALTSPGSRRDTPATWLFPELVVALAPWRVTPVTLAAGVATPLAVPNPMRIAIGFFLPMTDAVQTVVSPFSDPSLYGIPISTADRYNIFALDDAFSLVGGPWYGYNTAGSVVRVVEFLKPS